jgi:hypothetical protein
MQKKDQIIREVNEVNKKQAQTILDLQSQNSELLLVNKKQAETILDLQSQNTEQVIVNKKQAETVLDLHSQNTELEGRLGLHSGNSSFPPSRDLFRPPKPANPRKKGARKAGGQKNVKG